MSYARCLFVAWCNGMHFQDTLAVTGMLFQQIFYGLYEKVGTNNVHRHSSCRMERLKTAHSVLNLVLNHIILASFSVTVGFLFYLKCQVLN